MRAIVTLIAVASFSATAGEPLSADATLSLIEDKGPRAAVETIWNTEAWEQLRLGVASGAPAWLKVAKEIRPGTDAGSTSELSDVVAWALPKAPEGVLTLVANDQASWEVVCSSPPVDEPPEGLENYYRRAIAAVRNVKRKSLQRIRAICLPQLEAAAKMSRQ